MTSRVRIAHASVTWLPSPLQGPKDASAARVTFTVAAEGAPPRPGVSSAALELPSAAARKVQVPVYLDVLSFCQVRPRHTDGPERQAPALARYRASAALVAVQPAQKHSI